MEEREGEKLVPSTNGSEIVSRTIDGINAQTCLAFVSSNFTDQYSLAFERSSIKIHASFEPRRTRYKEYPFTFRLCYVSLEVVSLLFTNPAIIDDSYPLTNPFQISPLFQEYALYFASLSPGLLTRKEQQDTLRVRFDLVESRLQATLKWKKKKKIRRRKRTIFHFVVGCRN